MAEMKDLLEEGLIGPIQHLSTFCISQLDTTMSSFSKGVHTGKFVITFNNPLAKLKVSLCQTQKADFDADEFQIARTPTQAKFDPTAAYLLVGCLGGLGRSLALWMVERGARHLVFLSRSGADRAETVALAQELKAAGATPEVVRCDVTCQEAVTSAVKDISRRQKVKGVIHAAMIEGVSAVLKITREDEN